MGQGSLTAFLISSGEPSTTAARDALRAQSVPFVLDEVTGVTPMDRAFQAMLDRCQTPLFVQVDADMILTTAALARLRAAMDAQPPDVAIYCGWLWGDAEERPVVGVKVYRHELVKDHPFTPSGSCEMTQVQSLEAAGLRVAVAPQPADRSGCLGTHWSLQTPEMAFRRWRRLMQKFRAFPWMSWLAQHPQRLLEQAVLEESPTKLAAALGAAAGLAGDPLPATEVDAAEHDAGANRVATMMARGPTELVLYVTDRCNHGCGFCCGAGVDDAQDMSLALVEHCLTAWPSAGSVCVAGFGEPLLHPDLPGILAGCMSRGRNVSLITNGSLLAKRAVELPRGLLYLSVSLNATNGEEHGAATGVRTWPSVLDGVRAALAAGHNCGVSYVCTADNLARLPAFLALARDLGARFVDLPAVLPRGNAGPASLLHDTAQTRALLQVAKDSPGAELVTKWPVLLPEDMSDPPRNCSSPRHVIGVDPRGGITGCRRLIGPSSSAGQAQWGSGAWYAPALVDLRLAMCGDRELPAECRSCWACWRDY